MPLDLFHRIAGGGTILARGLKNRREHADEQCETRENTNMISLKKHIDSHDVEVRKVALDCYRETLIAVGKGGEKALPALGVEFSRNLTALADRLSADATPPVITEAKQQVANELERWGENGVRYFKEKAREVQEILMAVASATQAVGERDERYAARFGELTERLREIAHLEDVSAVRSSLMESAVEMAACIARMTEEGRESTSKLRQEVATYRAKLEEAEKQGSRDVLTGLANRSACDAALAEWIVQKKDFCVLFLDLNGFKAVNDSHGHMAGDDLLRQFAKELREQVRASDVVGRWGGDEFLCLIECRLDQLAAHRDRISRWVFGEYKVETGNGAHRVKIDAAVGSAEWNSRETAMELIERVDVSMYLDKQKKNR